MGTALPEALRIVMVVALLMPLAGCLGSDAAGPEPMLGFQAALQVDQDQAPLTIHLGPGAFVNALGQVQEAGMLHMQWNGDYAFAALDDMGQRRWFYLPCERACDRSIAVWGQGAAPFGIEIARTQDGWIPATSPSGSGGSLEGLWRGEWTTPTPIQDGKAVPRSVQYDRAQLERLNLQASSEPGARLATTVPEWPPTNPTRSAQYLYNGEEDTFWNGEGSVHGALEFVRDNNPDVDSWLSGAGCVEMVFYSQLRSDPGGGTFDLIHDSRSEQVQFHFSDGSGKGMVVDVSYYDNTLGGDPRTYQYMDAAPRPAGLCPEKLPSAPLAPIVAFMQELAGTELSVHAFVVTQDSGFVRYTVWARSSEFVSGGYQSFLISWDATNQKMLSASLPDAVMQRLLGL